MPAGSAIEEPAVAPLAGACRNPARILLVEANNMSKWVGGDIPFEVHVPPIGLMYLAAWTRKVLPGAEVRIIESSLHAPSDREYTALLEDFKPDVVGVRSIVFFLEELQRIAWVTRALTPATIVAGGPIVKACREELFAHAPEIDVAVKGEGEQAFGRILSGEPFETIPGVLYRSPEGVRENADGPEVTNVDSIPLPAYDLVDLDLYGRQLSYAYNHRRQGVLVTSRGCVYNCTFCFNHWQGLRLRSAENVFREIETLYRKHGIRDFYIIDDIFNVNLKRALDLFNRIIAARLKLRLYFANGLRADIASEEFIDRAIQAGAIWFTYAIESACEEIQKLVNKRVNLAQARRMIAYTQRQGVVVNISTMFGFPTETPEQAQRTLDWLGELPKPSVLPYHFCLRFFPGCEINRQAIEAGWEPSRLESTSRFSYNDLPMGTPSLPRSEMFRILLEYHTRFGLNNAAAVAGSVRTLQSVGYSDHDLLHMYSVLKRKMISSVDELTRAGAT